VKSDRRYIDNSEHTWLLSCVWYII